MARPLALDQQADGSGRNATCSPDHGRPPQVKSAFRGARSRHTTGRREIRCVLVFRVLRRWLLSLKALAWLVGMLSHEWQWVRVWDLSCSAFASISPTWPRPRIAISHRSGDVKSILHNSAFWGSADTAIDAQKVPAWETNTGMIWQLFAATPIIARVNSPNYQTSVWCMREFEMSQFFVDSMDFLQDRRIINLVPNQLFDIATSFEAPHPRSQSLLASKRDQDFPPTVFVLVVPQLEELISKLFAAIATLRLLHFLIRDTGHVNKLGADLTQGREVDLPAPTNNLVHLLGLHTPSCFGHYATRLTEVHSRWRIIIRRKS